MIVVLGDYHSEFSREEEPFLAHRDYMARLAEQGKILCSGPRDGGSVILAYGADVAGVRAMMEEDPFYSAGIVTFDYLPFRVGMVDPASNLELGA